MVFDLFWKMGQDLENQAAYPHQKNPRSAPPTPGGTKEEHRLSLTCSHGTESFDLLFPDPVSVRIICGQCTKWFSDNIGVNHQADIFGDL